MTPARVQTFRRDSPAVERYTTKLVVLRLTIDPKQLKPPDLVRYKKWFERDGTHTLRLINLDGQQDDLSFTIPPGAAQSEGKAGTASAIRPSIHQGRLMSSLIRRVTARWLTLGAACVLSAACTSIPTQELSQYRQAFAATQTASEAGLMDFADAVQAEQVRQRAIEPAARPAGEISAELENGGSKPPDAIEVRRRAVRTIDHFNSVITTLAEGKSVKEVQGTATGFINAAQSFVVAAGGNAVPGLGSLTGVVNTLLAQIEQARARAEFEQAVRSGAPIITAMLNALIEEREQHMDLRVDQAKQREVIITDELTMRAAALRSLIGDHTAPARDDPRAAIQKVLNEALTPAQVRLSFQLPLQLSYQNGKPPLTAEQVILAQELLAGVKQWSDAFVANRVAIENLRAALNNYGLLLNQTQSALNTVVTNLGRPQSLQQISENLLGVAFELKSNLEAYGAARNGA